MPSCCYVIDDVPSRPVLKKLLAPCDEIGGYKGEQGARIQQSKIQDAAMLRDKYEDLERLKRLSDQGALTQEEFDGEKAKLLNG